MATPERLILASASQGRRYLLERAGYRFDIIPSHVDEPTGEGVSDPRGFVQQVAWLKAQAVAARVQEGLILAADSTGWHDGQVIGKPVDRADAKRILTALAGTRHELWTGVCLWRRPGDLQIAWQELSVVEMKPLSEKELEDYLDLGIWEGKAGAYGIQEDSDPFIHVLSGSISNVIGLPLESLARVLGWAESSGVGISRASDLNPA
jgi:septum formation protein